MDFTEFVLQATGEPPFPYQQRLADDGMPDVLNVPTGAGKTLAAVLPWLHRRRRRQEDTRWLVLVLPQRALVEQTVRVISGWLANLADETPVHMLMGGEDDEDKAWKSDPATQRVFVGTQDMVLSRLLMRGFAESRIGWPMSFGLLHAGVQFVFDEVQLMGPGLATSTQLQGFRERIGTALPCRSMWMSATLDPARLASVDFSRELTGIRLSEHDRAGLLGERLSATRVLHEIDVEAEKYADGLAARVASEHRAGTRTLVVLNTVDRASDVYQALEKHAPDADRVLLHSRFRPQDRRQHTIDAEATPRAAGTIVVATQVLEAGIDLTSETLITELALWSSMVQRAGRCNRYAETRHARLLWVHPPGRNAHLPYTETNLAASAAQLRALEGEAVTGEQLGRAKVAQDEPVYPLPRYRDLLSLFDTSPDLAGNDIDVGPFIRDEDERTVFLCWRHLDGIDAGALPARVELCPAPIVAARDIVGRITAVVYDQQAGEWRRATRQDVRPTALLVLDAVGGGYLPELGFAPKSRQSVDPVPVQPNAQAAPEAMANDPHSQHARRWVPLEEHLLDTEREAEQVLEDLEPELDPAVRRAIVLAARYHDLGKAHPSFGTALAKANPATPPPRSEQVYAKSPGSGRLDYHPPHFRHELVSALLLRETALLDGEAERDLIAYLALAHHGKVRLAVRARENEREGTVLGVRHGDRTLDTELLPATELSLDATRLGEGSLADRALALRDRADLGVFRLAFCEAVVRSADWRASGGKP